MVDGQPVEPVPGHGLGDDVAVQVVVEDQVRDIGEIGELPADVRGAKRRAVFERGRQVEAHAADDPGNPDEVPPPLRPDQPHGPADLTTEPADLTTEPADLTTEKVAARPAGVPVPGRHR